MTTLQIPCKDDIDFYRKYISLYQGDLNLTEKESFLLLEIVKQVINEHNDGNTKHTAKVVFNKDSILKICKLLSISINQYHNLKNALLDKKALFKQRNELVLNPLLLPRTEIGFKFNITKNGK